MSRQLDDSDSAVFLMYGLAMREVQWFEICLGGLLEAKTKDLRTPVEERLPEIERQLRLTPGKVARKLNLPEEILKDLRELVGVRHKLAHVWLLSYGSAREQEGDAAVTKALQSLEEQLFVFTRASERLVELAAASSEEADAGALAPERALSLWRGSEPVIPVQR